MGRMDVCEYRGESARHSLISHVRCLSDEDLRIGRVSSAAVIVRRHRAASRGDPENETDHGGRLLVG